VQARFLLFPATWGTVAKIQIWKFRGSTRPAVVLTVLSTSWCCGVIPAIPLNSKMQTGPCVFHADRGTELQALLHARLNRPECSSLKILAVCQSDVQLVRKADTYTHPLQKPRIQRLNSKATLHDT
jgi:hypothetical protein